VSQVIQVGSQAVIDVVLAPDVTELSEVVVIGYGTRTKKDLTGAISVMEADEIEQAVEMTPEMAMQGRMAGVLVSSPSGMPNDRPTVRIRGVSTFGINDPLYVIDGVPITEFGSGFEQQQAVVRDIRGQVNVLSMINPDDIESISVLKDASAAAIYGVRAANGVILITTKKGKQARPKVDLNFRYGVANIPNTYDLLNVGQYTELYQEAYGNNPNETLPGWFDPTSTGAVPPYDKYLGDRPTVDWQDPMINNNAVNTDVNARVYGGSESTNYYVSTGYSYVEAPMKGNWQERYTLATNVTSKVAKWVEVGVTYRFAYQTSLVQEFNELTRAVSAPPWQPMLLEDDFYPIGSPVEDKYGYATVSDSTTTPNPDHPEFGGSNADAPRYLVDYEMKYGTETEFNTLAGLDERLNKTDYELFRNLGNIYLQLEPIQGLKIKGNLSFDWSYNLRQDWGSVDMAMFNITPGNPYSLANGYSLGTQRQRHKKDYNIVKELIIDWMKSFGDHNINITLSAMDQKYGFSFLQAGTEWTLQEDPEKRNIQENQDYTSVGEWIDRYALQGYMARASYHYASKYYVDATVRRDGTSRFAPDYRWGIFPSFAVAWRISAENFMSGINWINDLKIRAGWGQLGNQETAAFAYLSGVDISPQYAYGSGAGDPYGTTTNGLFLPDFPTEDLSWETATTTNIGFDGIFFNNRISATVEYYNRETADILQSVAFPASVGNYNSPIINVATVRNRGWEFQLGYNGTAGDFQYSFSGNFTTVDNEVMEVWNNQPFTIPRELIPGATADVRIEKGYPMNYLWGFKTGGIYQSQEEVLNWWSNSSDSQADSSLVSAGDFYFQDVHGPPNKEEGYDFYTPEPDGRVDLNDRTYIGNTIPKHFYGFNFGLNWKGIDLSLFFQGVGGVYKYNQELLKGVQMGSTGINQWVNVLNRWTPDRPHQWDPNDQANSLGRAVRGDPGGNNRFSDRFAQKAGFMRLRNFTLGYSLPASMLNKTDYVERVRFYVTGSNVWTVTKWDGPDPENDNQPIPVTWSGGINVTF
jgi:TonB-linked SusC/RagA family outer membrane protein